MPATSTRPWALLVLLALVRWCVVVVVAGEQVPMGDAHAQFDVHDIYAHDDHDDNDDAHDDYPPLNFSSTAPHLFSSAYSLLQQWANTVFPNGHSLAAATVPPYTLLHHGLRQQDQNATDDGDDALSPASPEWLALDPEMAYGIMGGARGSWLLTYQTTRRVRVLYVDGLSAALMGLGQLDLQMLLLYGNVTGPEARGGGGGGGGLPPEYDRARGLCGWLAAAGLGGRGWGFEGVVRMNAGFEVIWCDFQSDSLRLVSRLDVTVRGGKRAVDEDGVAANDDRDVPPLPPVPTRTDAVANPSHPPAPPNWRGDDDDDNDEPFVDAQGWAWFESAAWHYGASRAGPGAGETRLRLDPACGLVSMYGRRFASGPLAHGRAADEQARLNLTRDGTWRLPTGEGAATLNRTAALAQLARRRRFHHLGDASPDEAAQLRARAEAVLGGGVVVNGTSASEYCSGAEWPLILAEIVQRSARHLKTLEALLQRGPANASTAAAARWLHQLRSASHMFLVPYMAYPEADDDEGEGENPWRRGSARYNATLARCRYRYTRLLVDVPLAEAEADLRWAVEETQGTVCAGLVAMGFAVEGIVAAGASGGGGEVPLDALRRRWLARLEELLAWLGWEPEFLGCDEVCGWHERCFIPMWPLANRRLGGGRGRGRGHGRYGGYGPPPWGHGNRTGHGPGPGPGGPPNGSFPGFPRSPAMMGDDTDLWAPKCVEAWYM